MTSPEPQSVPVDLAAYRLIRDRLESVEDVLYEAVDSDVPLVAEVGRYLQRHGGKRLRPALVLLCARLCDYRGEADVELGAIVEFIHTATLVHDDVIDGASVRRGGQAVNRAWGNQVAVLLGDFLYARSLAMSVELGDLRIVEVLTRATTRLVEGEILDVVHNGDADLDEAAYLEMIDRKTAALFAGCGRSAAILAGASRETEERLADYGRNLGMAFQMIDDVLDYGADPERLGKKVGTDLGEGKVTLPLIHLLEVGPADAAELALSCLGDRERTAEELPEVAAAMEGAGSLAAVRRRAEGYADDAVGAISDLPESPVRDALLEVPEFVLARGH